MRDQSQVSSFPATPLQFRLPHGVECVVHEDAIRALGLKAAQEIGARHRRLLEAIATEKFEWSPRMSSIVTIGEKDVAAHLNG